MALADLASEGEDGGQDDVEMPVAKVEAKLGWDSDDEDSGVEA